MADNVVLSPASRSDISTLAAIWPITMRINPVMNFIFPNQTYDSSAPFAYILRVYEQALQQGTSHFLKATCRKTGKIVGFAAFKVEDGAEKDGLNGKELQPHPPLPDNSDRELYSLYFGGRARKEEVHMAAQDYAAVAALHVLPAYQGHGIGSALMRYGLTMLRLKERPMFVITTMKGRKIYEKFGWKQVDVIDVDLGAREEALEGYGMHRSLCMIRARGEAGL